MAARVISTQNKQKVIRELRRNGRARLKDISTKTSIPLSTTHDMVNHLEKEEIISYCAQVTFEKLGYPVRVFCSLHATADQSRKLETYLSGCRHVNSVYKTERGYLVDGVFKDRSEVDSFLSDLELSSMIDGKELYSVASVMFTEKFLSADEHFNEA